MKLITTFIILSLSGCKLMTHQPIDCKVPKYPRAYIRDRVPYGLLPKRMELSDTGLSYIIPNISFEACLAIRVKLKENE